MNANPNADFEYSALNAANKEIRLLTLESINDLGDVICSLKPASLHSSNLEFLALSYTWGTAEAADYIHVNGQVFWVRPNLYDFFTGSAASQLVGHSIFIDAICINQGNQVEKAEQIQHMREIYSKATSVIAWLGAADDGGDNEPDVEDVISRDFWSRLWIVQEVVLAQDLTIQYGDYAFKPEELMEHDDTTVDNAFETTRAFVGASEMMEEIGLGGVAESGLNKFGILGDDAKERETIFNASRATRILAERRNRHRSAGKMELPRLHQAITIFGSHKRTDSKDGVFGLLGLAQSSIRADYSMPIMELYIRTLIEGVYAIATEHGQSSSAQGVDLGKDYIRQVSQYQPSCMMALSITYYPFVTLVTTRVLQHCGVIPLTSGLYSGFHQTVVNVCDHDSRRAFAQGASQRWDLLRAGFVSIAGRIASVAASAQVHNHRKNGTKLGFQGDLRTFDEWISLVDRIADEYDENGPEKRPLPRDLVGPGSPWRLQ
jgi:hypothetical protein